MLHRQSRGGLTNQSTNQLIPCSAVLEKLPYQFLSLSRNSLHFMEPKVLLPLSQKPDSCPHPEPVQSIPRSPITFKIDFNITLPSKPRSSNRSLPLKFPNQNSVHTSPLPSPTRATYPDNHIPVDFFWPE